MPDARVLVMAMAGAGIGAALLLLLLGIRGTVRDLVRPQPRIVALLRRSHSPMIAARLLGGLATAILVGAVTHWPVAALGIGALVVFWPALMGGSRLEKLQTIRLAAVVSWCESLRDTAAGHAGLEQAIPATAENAPASIRPALLRLTGLLRSKVPLEQGLQDLAEQLDHSADLIIAALQMNVRSRGDGLVGVLTNLAIAGREELDLRRKITAGRAGDRRAMQLMLMIVVAVACFLILFSANYTAPYQTVTGQFVLTVVLALFAASFLWIRRLASAHPPVPFLPVTGQITDPIEERIVRELTSSDSPGAAWSDTRADGGGHR